MKFQEMVSAGGVPVDSYDDEGVEMILLGTGKRQHFAAAELRVRAAELGIGLECMTTAAACRTYILLQSEGRQVWAWLWA